MDDNLPRDVEPKDAHAVSVEEADALRGEGAYAEPLPPFEGALGAPTHLEGWYAIGTGLLYLVFFRLTTFAPFHVSVVVAFTLFALALTLVFTVRVARALRTPRALTINLILSALLTLPLALVPILASLYPTWAGWPTVGGVFLRYRGLLAHVMGLDGLILMWFAACLGVAVSRLIREIKLLLPVSVVLACVDMYVVFGGGLVTQATKGGSPVAAAAMRALTVKLPTAHHANGAAPLQLAIGMADFLFIALFFACFKRFGVAAWNTFAALCVVLSIYMLLVAFTGLPLPALVPIGLVVLGMNLRQFRYERSEAFALLYAALILGALGGVIWALRR